MWDRIGVSKALAGDASPAPAPGRGGNGSAIRPRYDRRGLDVRTSRAPRPPVDGAVRRREERLGRPRAEPGRTTPNLERPTVPGGRAETPRHAPSGPLGGSFFLKTSPASRLEALDRIYSTVATAQNGPHFSSNERRDHRLEQEPVPRGLRHGAEVRDPAPTTAPRTSKLKISTIARPPVGAEFAPERREALPQSLSGTPDPADLRTGGCLGAPRGLHHRQHP